LKVLKIKTKTLFDDKFNFVTNLTLSWTLNSKNGKNNEILKQEKVFKKNKIKFLLMIIIS